MGESDVELCRFSQRYHRLNHRITINDQRRMPLSSRILRQQRRTGSKTMCAPIAESDFHLAREEDEILASWRTVPIAGEPSGTFPKENGLCWLRRG